MAQPSLNGLDHRPAVISREELRARLADQRLLVIDVMPKQTYADRHIPGAVNLPVAEIETKARRLVPNLWQEVVIYCAGPT